MDYGNSRRSALGCLMIVAAVIVCGGLLSFGLDRICVGYLPQRLPIYPNATVTFRDHNLFTEFGMGNTVLILDSPDEPDVVRAWYATQTGTFLRASLDESDPIVSIGRRIARVDWDVTRAEDGTGTQIILFTTCVN